MGDIQKRLDQLPVKPEDLSKWILIGKVKLKAQIAAIKAISKLEEGVAAHAAALSDTQDLAEELLYAEARMGDMLANQTSRGGSMDGKRGSKPSRPECISDKQSHFAQTLSCNEDKIAQVVAEAREKGEVPVRQHVLREVAHVKQKAKVQAIKDKEIAPPTGKYDVIVIDPPWPMQKIERECAPNQVSQIDYPTMDEGQMAGIDLPVADACHIWLWTTHKFLSMALRLLDAWDLKYVCCFVWHKPGGFQPFNLPQYNCEFALYARHGSPVFSDTKKFNTCFDAPRQKHSEKPQEFYDVVRRVTAGQRLDMFSRRKIEGFEQWGLEAE